MIGFLAPSRSESAEKVRLLSVESHVTYLRLTSIEAPAYSFSEGQPLFWSELSWLITL